MEIKVRAFDEILGLSAPFSVFSSRITFNDGLSYYELINIYDNLKVELFTTRQDVNGVDLYAGDRCRAKWWDFVDTGSGVMRRVEGGEHDFEISWNLETVSFPELAEFLCFVDGGCGEIEKIGTIHDPEFEGGV